MSPRAEEYKKVKEQKAII